MKSALSLHVSFSSGVLLALSCEFFPLCQFREKKQSQSFLRICTESYSAALVLVHKDNSVSPPPFLKLALKGPGLLTHTCHPGAQEVEAGGSPGVAVSLTGQALPICQGVDLCLSRKFIDCFISCTNTEVVSAGLHRDQTVYPQFY